jgi:hypothetical protein
MNPRKPLSAAEWIVAVGILVVAGAVVLVTQTRQLVTIQCDGSVPTWMITEENAGTGCVELLPGPPPRDWDGSWICIGLCDGFQPPSPYYPSDEP